MLIFRKWMSDKRVEKNYVAVGAWVGDVVSVAIGEAVGMGRKVNQWEKWEQEYAIRGYRTVSLDRFIGLGGYGKSIDDVIGQKRMFEEEPRFHAKIYKDRYLGKIQYAFNFEKMMQDGQPQSGTFVTPSTED